MAMPRIALYSYNICGSAEWLCHYRSLPKLCSSMRKSILFSFAAVFLLATGSFCNPAEAQLRKSNGIDFSLQGSVEAPLGDSGVVRSGAYGVTLTASLPLSTLIDITAGIGYLKFGQTDVSVDSASGKKGTVSKQYTNYPFFAGIRFVFDGPVLLPYFGGEISLNDLVYHVTTGVTSASDAANTKLGYAILAGARVPFSSSWSVDATAKYHVIPGDAEQSASRFLSVNLGLAVHLDL